MSRKSKAQKINLPMSGTIILPLACSARHRDFAIFAAPEEELKTLYTSVTEVKVTEFKTEPPLSRKNKDIIVERVGKSKQFFPFLLNPE